LFQQTMFFYGTQDGVTLVIQVFLHEG
jgi:hypothetical protein